MDEVHPGAAHDWVEDAFLGGRLRLRQPRRGHRVGTDAVLLQAAAGEIGRARVIDLGAGVGAVGLALALRAPEAHVTLVEREPTAARLCRENVMLNGFCARAVVLEADVLARGTERRAAGLAPSMADLLVTNPPFHEAGRVRSPDDGARSLAHVMPGPLDRWLRSSADLVRPGGRIVVIHRADALAPLLAALEGRFGGLRVKPVHARAGEPALRVLVSGIKGSRAPLALLSPLVLHRDGGGFTVESEALHRGDALVDLA